MPSRSNPTKYNRSVLLNLVRLLAVAIALVIPVQGMAALTAGLCMSFGHHDTVAADQGHAAHGHAADSHAPHSHDQAGPGAPVADTGDDSHATHCGPCTGCCTSVSIAGPIVFTIAAAPTHPKYILSQHPPLGVQPSGLYRPPLAL
jgi:hypothetical protein